MELISPLNLRVPPPPPTVFFSVLPPPPFSSNRSFSLHFWANPNPNPTTTTKSCKLRAKKKQDPQPNPVLRPTLIEEVVSPDIEDEDFDEDLDEDFVDEEDEAMVDGEDVDVGFFEEGENDDAEYFEFEEDDDEDDVLNLYAGDGAGGGGVKLAGTWWDKEVLRIAKEVCLSFGGEFKLYAFKTLPNSVVRVRIECLSHKTGSPTMQDLEAFTVAYRARLDEAELAKTIPDNIYLEVSSPGSDRVVQVPEELDRFKDQNMYVKYVEVGTEQDSLSESIGVFRLISFDMEEKCCTWGLANVRVNREKAGKGRKLNKKQREWRLDTSFDSLRLVRLYSDY
ncbi:hypothetical protein Tsubulata_010202 [Turnera subulata]|uniref:Ribosome maturation factor RimP N-terminal domain-containing protein n=1 Tax=Turnera subulata TaxID=218843 RepID=A0A9Q0FI04_9ROSI|nr:hypothetical protein Tsubulata_010202 [Turnera subulata]